MQEDDLKRLTACHKFLVDNLEADELSDYIYSKGILSDEEKQDIDLERNSFKSARILLRFLRSKGPTAYAVFCEALVETNKQFVVDELNKVETTTIVVSSSPFDEEDKMAQLQRQMNAQTELMLEYKRDRDTIQRRLEESERRLDMSERRTAQLHQLQQKQQQYSALDQLLQEKGISTQQARNYLAEYLDNQDVPDFAFQQGENTGSPMASPAKTATGVTASRSFTFSLADVEENSLLECERIARYVGKDLVRYVVQKTQQTGQIRAPSNAYTRTMRTVVDEILDRHDKLFTHFIVKLNMDQIKGYDTFVTVADEIFAEGDFNWGRVGVLFAFAGFVARFAAENGNERMATFMGDFIGFYVAKKLGKDINNQGGWVSRDAVLSYNTFPISSCLIHVYLSV